MTRRVRIVAAAAFSLAVGAGYWAFEAWPAWYGRDVHVPVAIVSSGDAGVHIEFPDSRVTLDLPASRGDESRTPHVPVRPVGAVWPPGSDMAAISGRLRGRVLYLQLEERGGAVPGGRRAARPVAISDTPIDAALNLRVRVRMADQLGRLTLDIGPARFRTAAPPPGPLPVEWMEAPGPDGAMRPVEPVARAWAVLRVLPGSGRHVMVGLVAEPAADR